MNSPAPARFRTVLACVAVGGALGAMTRHGLDILWPPAASGVSWTILVVNVTGALFISLLAEVLKHRRPHDRYTNPFWSVGFLGGYTTFSVYTTDVITALERGAPQVALVYLVLTLVGALAASWAGSALAQRLLTHDGGRNS